MSVIGSLAVNVVANTEKFSQGMGRARGEMKSFSKAASALESSLKGVVAGFAAGFAFESLRATANEIEQITLASQRLGLSVESFTALSGAAEMSQISTEDLIKSLTFMEKNLGKNSKAFDKLGLSASSLGSMGAHDAFLKIADAIAALPTPAERTAAAMEIFGKSGAKLLPILSGGSAGVKELEGEVRSLGGVLSTLSAEEIDEMNDAIDKLGVAFKGLKYTVVTFASPFVTDFVEQLVNELKVLRLITNEVDKVSGKLKDLGHWKRSVNVMAGGKLSDLVPASGTVSAQTKSALEAGFGDYSPASSRGKPGGFGGLSLGPGGAFAMGAVGTLIIESATHMAAEMAKAQEDAWRNLGGTDEAHIAGMLSMLGVVGNAPKTSPLRNGMQVQGNAALEYGTAAAFSQEKRAQQASQLSDNAKQQLKQNELQTKSLQSIDKNLAKMKQLEVVNIA